MISGPPRVCTGESVTLDAGAGHASHLWSTSDTTQTISVSPVVTTNYTVTVTDSLSCSGTSPDHILRVSDCGPVFSDWFEARNTSAWSLVVGGSKA